MNYDFRLIIEVGFSAASRIRRASIQALACAFAICALLLAPSAQAQWLTQSFALKAGWNAVYLHVDASHATLTELIDSDSSNPITEVWLWAPPVSTHQFVESPQLPVESSSQWFSWSRTLGPSSSLQRLNGNVACLVRVTNVANYVWHLKGKPVPPQNNWTITGLNFLGFPAPAVNPPFWEGFLAKAPELQQNIEVYRYPGGDLGTGNPARLFAFRTTPLRRGEAFWMRAGTSFNRYFGPFELNLQSLEGVHFRDAVGQYRVRLRNTIAEPVTVTVNLLASESAPVGQAVIAGTPPVLVRGALNLTNLTHGYSSLTTGSQNWTLAAKGQPGSELEVILGLNRAQMSGSPGDLYAGILRFTDNLGLTQVDVPVSAAVASNAGLWVGGASVQYVSHYLKQFARATNQTDFIHLLDRLQLEQGADGVRYEWDENTGRVLVFGGPQSKTGSYLLDGPIKVDSGTVPRPFPLRLIVHNDGSATRLLQRVYVGVGAGTNAVIATRENLLLASHLAEARRISSVHLPFSDGNAPWSFSGTMQQGGSLTTSVDVSYDDQASNPFLHTYHPDHDNLDAFFASQQDQGVESYGITRQITLNFTPPADNFNSLTGGGQALTGDYVEVVTFHSRGNQTQEFHTLGTFTLTRISPIATLTTP